MTAFNFEKNLPHQQQAVACTIHVFEGLNIQQPIGIEKQHINPIMPISNILYDNIKKTQNNNHINESIKTNSSIIDIMMETGTGKTYTYTQTIFELNKYFGIFKFIIVVPTLSIKAGTIDFLKSESSRTHFKEQYNKTIDLHIVESKKNNKSKKSYMPSAVINFVEANTFDKNNIQLLVINAGMINSDTMQKQFDKGFFDKYTIPFDALKAVRPFLIIDEPHKFDKKNKTWENIQKIKPQFILRYGATFPEYENLIYTLTAIDAFNRNLVKGVVGHITEFSDGQNAIVKLMSTDGQEACFELIENGKKKIIKLKKDESLEKVHPQMTQLLIDNLNRTKVILSNGVEMSKGSIINPYSYSQTLQESIIQKAIKHHFEIEKELFTRSVKIKPLTLFFIDNIVEYRGKEGYIKKTIETSIEQEVKILLKNETNHFYKNYLQETLKDLSKTHGGYFSKDNVEKDEDIEKEINEILHDKQAMLSLQNPRRFIFSKWTLREGWDNPNVFQICKLRSSGSEISKLQEVGRGLRLPVNEYGNRVKDEQFYLHYFVDFTESDFVDKLINEINEKSNAISIDIIPNVLDDNMIKKICEIYKINDEKLLKELEKQEIITRTNNFKEGGFNYIKKTYPLIFEGVHSSKIRKSTDAKKNIPIRAAKYNELKELWEKINERVLLEYKIEKESDFQQLFIDFLATKKDIFSKQTIEERIQTISIDNNKAIAKETTSIFYSGITSISTMKYSDFLKELSKTIHINLHTLHQSFSNSTININEYLNVITIRSIKQEFDTYLMLHAIDKFSIEYQKVSNVIHPTKLTDAKGNVKKNRSNRYRCIVLLDEQVADSYFFGELYYDSDLEKDNIKTQINEVIVFTKIPKNSIKIPVAGGKSYSPDFAYVVNYKTGNKKLYFIVETKNAEKEELRKEEIQKIKHAEKLFGNDISIQFKTQFSNDKIKDLITEIIVPTQEDK